MSRKNETIKYNSREPIELKRLREENAELRKKNALLVSEVVFLRRKYEALMEDKDGSKKN